MIPSHISWGQQQEQPTAVAFAPWCEVPAGQVQTPCLQAPVAQQPPQYYWQGHQMPMQLPMQPAPLQQLQMPMQQMQPMQQHSMQQQPMQQQPMQQQPMQQLPMEQQPVQMQHVQMVAVQQVPAPSIEVRPAPQAQTHAIPEPSCGPPLASVDVSTAPSEASPREEALSTPAQPKSASAARRLRRKRAAERKGETGTQKDTEHLSVEDLRPKVEQGYLLQLRGNVWKLSQDKEGCRLVQKALEHGGRDATAIADELSGHVLEASKHPHANYVVQKAVMQLSVEGSAFIVAELQGSAVHLAKHRMGCRIFCRLLEFCSTSALMAELVDELLADVTELCRHSFGHHVIQSILEHGQERHKHVIAQTLTSDALNFAQHRNTSYLIEKMMASYSCSDEDQCALLRTLDIQQLLFLAKTQYGHHVAKTMLMDKRWYSLWTGGDFEQVISPFREDLENDRFGSLFLKDMGRGLTELAG